MSVFYSNYSVYIPVSVFHSNYSVYIPFLLVSVFYSNYSVYIPFLLVSVFHSNYSVYIPFLLVSVFYSNYSVYIPFLLVSVFHSNYSVYILECPYSIPTTVSTYHSYQCQQASTLSTCHSNCKSTAVYKHLNTQYSMYNKLCMTIVFLYNIITLLLLLLKYHVAVHSSKRHVVSAILDTCSVQPAFD